MTNEPRKERIDLPEGTRSLEVTWITGGGAGGGNGVSQPVPMTNTPSPTDEDRELIERWLKAAAYCEGHKGLMLEDDQYAALATDLRKAADRLESLLSDRAKLEEALRSISEGNLGSDPWQANYARIREVATAALNRSTDHTP